MNEKNKGILFSWEFPEFEKHKRSLGWYLSAIIIGGALLVYSVVTFNILFALIIILFIFISFLHSYQEPPVIKFEITEDGIRLGRKFFPYKELSKFWIVYDPPKVKNLYLDFKSFIKPTLSVPLLDQNPISIRKFLLENLEEDLEKEEEDLSDSIGKILKL